MLDIAGLGNYHPLLLSTSAGHLIPPPQTLFSFLLFDFNAMGHAKCILHANRLTSEISSFYLSVKAFISLWHRDAID